MWNYYIVSACAILSVIRPRSSPVDFILFQLNRILNVVGSPSQEMLDKMTSESAKVNPTIRQRILKNDITN
jgi:hypothetical protein